VTWPSSTRWSNNADRKIGHLLPLPDGRLYGCDHGVCFGEEYKLRTVLWQWRGRRLPGAMQALAGCRRGWPAAAAAELAALLSPAEVRGRATGSTCWSSTACTPTRPRTGRRLPWPPV